ncbi:cytochrome P450 [Fomitiporia mediterranea MF3/22]|uniref:cytochrome P450 n=1 Tax=Fomitiporia mediterranea (strain MF3/22) TaxID=694068 RepID=UPI00044082A2|nr:cytochrome P450 [Fomitiporia mediterranea MF3/22]EJD08216.1 cytochrome P450 [Fomitiporia mediterranea MF3/22]
MQSVLQADLNVKTFGIIAAVLLPLAVIYQLWLYPYFITPLRKTPGPKGSLLSPKYVLFGEFPAIMYGEAGVVQREWAKQYGPIVRAVGPFGIHRLMFLSPVAMQKVLVSDWTEYPRPDFMRNILGLVAGYGLLTVTGDEHRTMRRAMNPAFSIPSLTAQTDMYYKPLYDLVEILKGQIKNSTGNVLYMYDWMSRVTLDIICLTAFGYECDSLHNPSNELADAYHKLLDLQNGSNLARIIALVSVPGVPYLFRTEWLYNHRHWMEKVPLFAPGATLIECMRRIKRVSAMILEDAKSHAAAVVASDSTLACKKDVMSLLVQARMREGSSGPGFSMTDAMMMEQVLTFLGAGHETTASGLAWTLWLLATHPDVQTKLREEVTRVLADDPNPDFRTLKGMEYLDHVVMEALRVFPPVPMTIRKSGKNDYIDGVYVPKNTLFYIAIRVINTYKDFWGEDAEEFHPERWAKLNEAPGYHSTHSFQSFINGPHHCIGKTMAIVEMKAVLAIIIANFEFAPAYAGQKPRPTAAVTMKPADNLPLLVRPVKK